MDCVPQQPKSVIENNEPLNNASCNNPYNITHRKLKVK